MMSKYIILIILVLILIIIILLIKLFNILKTTKEIEKTVDLVLNDSSNALITTSTSNKTINKFISNLNIYLKDFHKKELQFKNGNQELQKSITNISHDLRTPLTAIKGYIDFAIKEKNKNKRIEYLKIINNKTDDLIKLTEQLYDYSKSLDLKEKITKEKICINCILEDVITSYYALIKENNIEPKINITNKKIYRELDKNMLIRIFENVLSNAIKYTDNYIKISLLDDGTIIFENRAKSLDNTSVNKIFERYFTVENASKSSGIGLSIAKQLVEINNGIIIANYINGNLIIKIEFK